MSAECDSDYGDPDDYPVTYAAGEFDHANAAAHLIKRNFTPDQLRDFAAAWEAADRWREHRHAERMLRRLLGPTLRTVREGTLPPLTDVRDLARSAEIAIDAGLRLLSVYAAAKSIGRNAGLDEAEIEAELGIA
jgi:hypothetical protein